jgi:hypothetical protein
VAAERWSAARQEPKSDQELREWFELEKAVDLEQQQVQCAILRDIFGNPFRTVVIDPAWLTPDATRLAQVVYAERAFDQLPLLAEALAQLGCDNADLLAHLRGPGPHVRGCWALDAILVKE